MATMMNLSDLIKKANGKDTTEQKKELRREYAKAAAQIHPDKGGSEEEMAALNKEYETKEALLGLDDELREAVERILHIPGINIEICGTWIWVSGDTKAACKEIKEAGYRWARGKKMWYYKKENEFCRRSRKGGMSMSYIRDKYGSEELKSDGLRALIA